MPLFSNLHAIVEPFAAVLLDAYGVFWAGNQLGPFPGAKEAMKALVDLGKIVGILSNSTASERAETEKLRKQGLLENEHFHFLITSGTVTRQLLLNDQLNFPTKNKKFALFGEPHPKYSSHLSLFQGTLFQETASLAEADFVYISIPHLEGEDQTDVQCFLEPLLAIKSYDLPLLCANPDRFAHEGNPPRAVVRQGSIAALYESIGGSVFFVGKPYPLIYQAALSSLASFGLSDLQTILMVGDTPETDIKGANGCGIASSLVTKTGIMADRLAHQSLEEWLVQAPQECIPHFFIERI